MTGGSKHLAERSKGSDRYSKAWSHYSKGHLIVLLINNCQTGGGDPQPLPPCGINGGGLKEKTTRQTVKKKRLYASRLKQSTNNHSFQTSGRRLYFHSIFLFNDKAMRLTQTEIEVINSMAKKYFGSDAQVFLFGSRVDNLKKGGDIDLFIKNKNEALFTVELKVQFLAELKSVIGNQKIDVVFDNANTRSKRNFYQSIIQHNSDLKSNL